ncbi:MAG: hypothetical protein NVS1B11_34830 [Terriglobales bacterium]
MDMRVDSMERRRLDLMVAYRFAVCGDEVRGARPSKIAKGEAASTLCGAEVGQPDYFTHLFPSQQV